MGCPYCEAELDSIDVYGYLARHQSGEVLGEIYKCPNHDGFKDEQQAERYLNEISETLESLGVKSWEEVICENSFGNGFYYTNKSGDLLEGYPV